MLEVITTMLFAAMIVTLWLGVCNYRTSKQRQKMIDVAFGKPYLGTDYDDRRELRDEYHSISYEQHMFHLFLFRNVKKLYPKLYARMNRNV